MKYADYKKSISALRYVLNNSGGRKYKFKSVNVDDHLLVLNVVNRTIIASIGNKSGTLRYKPNSAYAPFFRSREFKHSVPSMTLHKSNNKVRGQFDRAYFMYVAERFFELLEAKGGKLPVIMKVRNRDKGAMIDEIYRLTFATKYEKYKDMLRDAIRDGRYSFTDEHIGILPPDKKTKKQIRELTDYAHMVHTIHEMRPGYVTFSAPSQPGIQSFWVDEASEAPQTTTERSDLF